MFPTKHNTNFVLFEQLVKVEGKHGTTKSWAPFKSAWVSITPKRGIERFVSEEHVSIVTDVIRGDYLSLEGITATMRMVLSKDMTYAPVADDARVFEILAVIPDDNHHADIMIQVQNEKLPYGKQGNGL